MALRSVHEKIDGTGTRSVTPSLAILRSHRSTQSRRAHRAAHAAARATTRRFVVVAVTSLLAPFVLAITIMELVR